MGSSGRIRSPLREVGGDPTSRGSRPDLPTRRQAWHPDPPPRPGGFVRGDRRETHRPPVAVGWFGRTRLPRCEIGDDPSHATSRPERRTQASAWDRVPESQLGGFGRRAPSGGDRRPRSVGWFGGNPGGRRTFRGAGPSGRSRPSVGSFGTTESTRPRAIHGEEDWHREAGWVRWVDTGDATSIGARPMIRAGTGPGRDGLGREDRVAGPGCSANRDQAVAACLAVILEEIPPRGVNWPTTVIERGEQAATRSSRITLITCS